MNILEELARDELDYIQAHGGPTWTHEEFERDFDLVGYCEPDLVVVVRRSDNQRGILTYVANRDGWPRTFFSFEPSNR